MSRRAVPAVLAAALLAAACGGSGGELPTYWRVPDFRLLDQRGDTLRASDLRGRVWAASFVFTNCRGICPTITTRMAALRDSLAADGLLGEEARLVSITTDPARDSVAALAAYADRFGGSPPSRWAFLTGSPPERMRQVIRDGFKLTVSVPDSADASGPAGYQVNHSPRVLLVDRRGRVRGTYNARMTGAFDSLALDLRRLAG